MSVRVIGFCDVYDFARGGVDDVYFCDDDCFIAEAIPRPVDLLAYATERGYYPSGKRGAINGKCDPIYFYIGSPPPHSIRPRDSRS